MSGAVLVHAVSREGAFALPEAASPITGGELAFIAGSGLAALVSLLPVGAGEELFAEPDAAAALSLRHHELLTELAAAADVAPVRLGALHADAAAVARLLTDQAALFRAALARIGGAQEFAVKLTPLADVVTPAPEAPAVSGRSFLQRRAEAASAKRNAGEAARAAATAAFEQLRAHASAHAFAPPRRHAQADQEKRLVDAALLVPRAGAAAFATAVVAAQEAAAAAGYRLSVRGPLPAYSFVAEAA